MSLVPQQRVCSKNLAPTDWARRSAQHGGCVAGQLIRVAFMCVKTPILNKDLVTFVWS